jgi:hypothetical protein
MNTNWSASKSVKNGGNVRIAFILGGAFQTIARNLNQIADMPYDMIVVADVEGEINQIGLPPGRKGYILISPKGKDQIGVLIDALGNDGMPPEAKLVSVKLRGREADPQRGMGQIPPLAWVAMERNKAEIKRALERVVEELKLKAGGTIVNCTVHAFRGMGGGFGRGSGRWFVNTFRSVFKSKSPQSSLSIRHYLADGLSWIGCGGRIAKNGATGAAEFLSDMLHDPCRQPHENQGALLVTIAPVQKDKEKRDVLVSEIATMILCRTFYDALERTRSNDAMCELLGNCYIARFAHFGRLPETDLTASVAVQYLPQLTALVDTDPSDLCTPSPIRQLVPNSGTTSSPSRTVDAVMDDVRAMRGQYERFLEELLGAYTADASILAERIDTSGRLQADDLIKVDTADTADIKQFLADVPLLEKLIANALTVTTGKSRKAAKRLADAELLIRSHCRFTYGNWMDKLCSWRSWILLLDTRLKRERKIGIVAGKARKANESKVLADAETEALKTFRNRVNENRTRLVMQINDAKTALEHIQNRGTAVDGVSLLPLDDVLPDILWAGGMDGNVETYMVPVLEDAVAALSIETIARHIFGYAKTGTITPRVLANLISAAMPEDIGTEWGSLDRSTLGREHTYFLPVSEEDLGLLQEEFRRIDPDAQLMRIKRPFVGGVQVQKRVTENDVVTPTYVEEIAEMGKDEGDLALSWVPGSPDPRQFVSE